MNGWFESTENRVDGDAKEPPIRSIDPKSNVIREGAADPIIEPLLSTEEEHDPASEIGNALEEGPSDHQIERAVRRHNREPVVLSDRFEFAGRMVMKLFVGAFGGFIGLLVGALIGAAVDHDLPNKGTTEVCIAVGVIVFAVLALLQVVKRPR